MPILYDVQTILNITATVTTISPFPLLLRIIVERCPLVICPIESVNIVQNPRPDWGSPNVSCSIPKFALILFTVFSTSPSSSISNTSSPHPYIAASNSVPQIRMILLVTWSQVPPIAAQRRNLIVQQAINCMNSKGLHLFLPPPRIQIIEGRAKWKSKVAFGHSFLQQSDRTVLEINKQPIGQGGCPSGLNLCAADYRLPSHL